MTLKLQSGTTNYIITFDLANVSETSTWTFELTSLASNEITIQDTVEVITTNDRYTSFTLTVGTEVPEKHINGVYKYRIYDDSQEQIGLMKLVSGEGGTTGTTPYQSNNENRDAVTYYRPNY